MSASIISKDKGTGSFGGGGGVILRPSATRVLCFYGGDGGTRGKTCDPPGASATCVPGCIGLPTDRWCDATTAKNGWCDGLPWRPEAMGRGVELDLGIRNYNEVVVDGYFWNDHLPFSVEAMIGSPGDPLAFKMHEQFMARYSGIVTDVPLLSFNKEKVECPFELLTAEAGRSNAPVDPKIRNSYRLDGKYAKWIPEGGTSGAATAAPSSCGPKPPTASTGIARYQSGANDDPTVRLEAERWKTGHTMVVGR